MQPSVRWVALFAVWCVTYWAFVACLARAARLGNSNDFVPEPTTEGIAAPISQSINEDYYYYDLNEAQVGQPEITGQLPRPDIFNDDQQDTTEKTPFASTESPMRVDDMVTISRAPLTGMEEVGYPGRNLLQRTARTGGRAIRRGKRRITRQGRRS